MSNISGETEFWDTILRWFAVGGSLGTGIGVIEGNLVVWIGVGAACGIALGIGRSQKEQ